MAELKTSIECIEVICQQGCNAVRETIDKLEQQITVPELQHLNSYEQLNILTELKSVMAVYDKKS